MAQNARSGHVRRRLRFRLTVSYVVFFSVLLVAVGFFFRETLSSILNRQTREALDQDWALLRSYLRIGRDGPVWLYQRGDSEESLIMERLQRIYMIADAEGRVWEISNSFRAIGIDSPEEIAKRMEHDGPAWETHPVGDITVLVRYGTLHVPDRPGYFVAIGRSMAPSEHVIERFTLYYFTLVPALVAGSALLGWFLAGRALQPLNEVAQTAESISGRNLSLRIPSRDAGDELDVLIDSFNRMIARLETSFEQIRRFSTDVSHELRTPITVIRGQLEVALMTANTEEELRTAVINVLQDVERLSKIVRALLLLSQSETGQLTLKTESLDLSVLLQDLVSQFEIPAAEAGVRISADLPPHCLGDVDKVQFDRMVSNLLSNAIKYTPAGGGVQLRLRNRGEYNEIMVEDTGCGIPPEHLPHVFERFYRVPSQDPHFEKGLGLGLSFVSLIVKVHGGSIHVESKLQEGTRFVVKLPTSSAGPSVDEPTTLST